MSQRARKNETHTADLVMAALGIVFGDIGTSPLYAIQVVLGLSGGMPTHDEALGLLSLIIWALLIIVSFKYVTLVMRADNHGEGGILALMSLLKSGKTYHGVIIAIGLFGAALIYGDGAITPAISVLSAVEGIKVISPMIAPFVLPIAIFILLTLFAIQYHGTARIGLFFGPIMCVWFLALGALGIHGIAQYPGVLVALNPWYALHYLLASGWHDFLILGGIFLAVTGAEALYADMGHIGVKPIRFAWYGLVLPSLILNYAGQVALLLAGQDVGDNIFYRLVPESMLIPMIVLATAATIIASQAIITGAFSMTRQAIQLGWCPRLAVTQTSAEGYGQIYVRSVNWLLMLVTLGLTMAFGSSERLAGAYGIAVSCTMLLTTMLMFVVMYRLWRWNLAVCVAVAGTFFFIDAVFVSANVLKLLEGGWVPLTLAVGIYGLMTAWHSGAVALEVQIQKLARPIDQFRHYLSTQPVARVPGTAVFLTRSPLDIPPIIIWHIYHSRSLHEHVVALTIEVHPVPWVPPENRITIEERMENFWSVAVAYGYMDETNIPAIIRELPMHDCMIDVADVIYYVGHETILRSRAPGRLPYWKESLYAFMHRNAVQISDYLSLPRDAVVELGRQIEV
jgi:KUP system potassium uptake protein